MNEVELLKNLVELDKRHYELSYKIKIWSHPEDMDGFHNELAQIEQEQTETKEALLEIEDKSHSKKAHESMIRQLGYYKTEINKARPGLKISRSQSTIVEHYFFMWFLFDMNHLISNEIHGIRIPAHLLYTFSDEDSVEIVEVTNFIDQEVQRLKNIEDINYLALREYFDSFKNRLQDTFIRK